MAATRYKVPENVIRLLKMLLGGELTVAATRCVKLGRGRWLYVFCPGVNSTTRITLCFTLHQHSVDHPTMALLPSMPAAPLNHVLKGLVAVLLLPVFSSPNRSSLHQHKVDLITPLEHCCPPCRKFH